MASFWLQFGCNNDRAKLTLLPSFEWLISTILFVKKLKLLHQLLLCGFDFSQH